jgi:hypothetical protein
MAPGPHEFLLRVKSLFRQRRMDREMAEELEFHQAMLRDRACGKVSRQRRWTWRRSGLSAMGRAGMSGYANCGNFGLWRIFCVT